MKEENKLVITVQPIERVSPKSVETVGFIKDVKDAAFIKFDQKELEAAEIQNLSPEGFSSDQLNTSLNLYSLGVNSKRLKETIDKSIRTIAEISEKEKQSLYILPYLIATFEEAHPLLAEDLQTTYSPEIFIQQAPPEFVPQRNQFALERIEGGFQPIKEVLGKGVDYAKGKIKDFAFEAIKKGGEKLLEEGATVAAEAGITVAAAGAEAAAGPPGWVLLAVQAAKKVLSFAAKQLKNAFGKIGELLTGEKDIKKQVMWISGAGTVIFLGLGMPVAAAASGLVAVGAGASIVGGASIGTGVAAFGNAAIYAITSVAAPAIGIPLIIAVILTPLIVAFFLFIINSGAYVVPPHPSLIPGMAGSPYIGVEKTADPSGPFINDVLSIGDGLEITYTITITAKKGTLTNITFDYDCKLISENYNFCPAWGNIIANGEHVANWEEAVPETISPADGPYVITYEQLFKDFLKDTATVDTFTVTADAEEKPGEKASGSESIIIGDPPLGCFVFEGFKENDPDYPRFLAAAAKLSSHINYIVKLCAKGDIAVKRNYTGTGKGACAGVSGNSLMYFNNCIYYNTHGQAFIDYLFAHESGHIYDHRSSDLSKFIAEGVMSEGGLPTYCIIQPPPPHEDFADTIGDYVDNGNLGPLCEHNDQRPFHICGGSWPLHCEFVKNVIFEE